MIKRILLPLDGSIYCRAAMHLAVEIAGRSGAEIQYLSVLEAGSGVVSRSALEHAFFRPLQVDSYSEYTRLKEQLDVEVSAITKDIPDVELYIKSWCPYCKNALAFLQARGIPFVAYDIEKDKNAAFRKRLLDGDKGVPFAIIYGQPVRGFSEKLYLKALRGRK